MPWQTGFHRDAQGRLTAGSSGTGSSRGGINRLADGTLRFTLAAPTKMNNGYPTDDNGNIAITTNATGAKWSGGFLRAPNGALVVSLNPGTWQTGYVRDSNGALSVTATS